MSNVTYNKDKQNNQFESHAIYIYVCVCVCVCAVFGIQGAGTFSIVGW